MTPVRTFGGWTTVVWPTRTPSTSVMALLGPGLEDPHDQADVARAGPAGGGGAGVLAHGRTGCEEEGGGEERCGRTGVPPSGRGRTVSNSMRLSSTGW